MMDISEENIDFERVVDDPAYRRQVIEFLKKRDRAGSEAESASRGGRSDPAVGVLDPDDVILAEIVSRLDLD